MQSKTFDFEICASLARDADPNLPAHFSISPNLNKKTGRKA